VHYDGGRADISSLAVILDSLLLREPPFDDPSIWTLLYKGNKGK
jgi:hypothetical protein